MKKYIIVLILLILSFAINMSFVSAKEPLKREITAGAETVSGTGGATSKDLQTTETCGVFGNPENSNDFAYYLQIIFNVIKFLGPILVLVMTIIDLITVTAEQKQDGELKKIGIKTLKRFIYAALIFFLPSLITLVFNWIGLYGTCGIS